MSKDWVMILAVALFMLLMALPIIAYKVGERWEQRKRKKAVDHEKITGFKTPEEFIAYEKGYSHAENAIEDYIKNWDGRDNSQIGTVLREVLKKFKDEI